MPISKKEFDEAKEKALLQNPLLRFLYEHTDKAYSLKELEEKEVFNSLPLAKEGYIYVHEINDVFYFCISEKGITLLNKLQSSEKIK